MQKNIKAKLKLKIALCACVAFTVAIMPQATAFTNVSEFHDEQSKLKEEQSHLDKKLKEARNNISEKQKYKTALQEKINGVQQEVDLLNSAILQYDKEIEKKEVKIKELQHNIDQNYKKLRSRIKAIYMAGNASDIEILLGAKDFKDLMDKSYLVQSISEHDKKLINNISTDKMSVENDKQKVIEEKNVVTDSKVKLETNMQELDELQAECDTLIAQLEKEKGNIEQKITINSDEQDKLSEQLAELQKQYVLENGGDLSSNFVPHGGYIIPTPECNIITAYWGDGRNHKGLDFACNGSAYGKPIIAVADGFVQVANKTDEWGSGWGYHIMIGHGNGYATQYAHCSIVTVNVGDIVKQGDIIGYIGNTGDSYGAHLHFECWFNGTRYDPNIELLL